jgi:type II secretory pathway pseudopilin PulG
VNRRSPLEGCDDDKGFSLIEVMIAGMILMIVAFSITGVLLNSIKDTAYARQRSGATNRANEAIEEIRALSWTSIYGGMSTTDSTWNRDVTAGNISGSATTGYCFEGNLLDVGGYVGNTVTVGASAPGTTGSCTASSTWHDPACLSQTVTATPPIASALTAPAPIQPHEGCYKVGASTYAIDVYITGASAAGYPASNQPLTATVVVTWAHPLRSGSALLDHVVTTTDLSSCTKGGGTC